MKVKVNKYNAEKYNGFDSKKEAARYEQLKEWERLGIITDLRTQVPYILIPAQYETINGKRKRVEMECKYIADFVYHVDGKLVVEDVKGFRGSEAYRIFVIKRKLMRQVYGIGVTEV